MSDFGAIATALAGRFAAAALTAPTGYRTIRLSTAALPNQMPPLPCVLVFPDSGEWRTGTGTRQGGHTFTVRFYYDQLADLSRAQSGLLAWLTVLADQLRGAVQLGGTVTRATIDSWSMGTLTYAGGEYAGLEFKVSVVTDEPWSATA